MATAGPMRRGAIGSACAQQNDARVPAPTPGAPQEQGIAKHAFPVYAARYFLPGIVRTTVFPCLSSTCDAGGFGAGIGAAFGASGAAGGSGVAVGGNAAMSDRKS